MLLGLCKIHVPRIYLCISIFYSFWFVTTLLLLNEVTEGTRGLQTSARAPPRLQGAPPRAQRPPVALWSGTALPKRPPGFPPAALIFPAAMLASRGLSLCTALRWAAPGLLASFHSSAPRLRPARVAVVSNGEEAPAALGWGRGWEAGQHSSSEQKGLGLVLFS